MDVFQAYIYGTAGWLGLQAGTLIIVPKLAISLLAKEAHYATDLEVYFSRSLGFSLAIIAIIVLFFTGIVPLSSSVAQPVSLEDGDAKSPYAVPIVRVTTLLHFIGLSYCYVRYTKVGLAGFVLGAMGYGIMAAVGGWCILFGTSGGKFSKRTGKDKRMAGFPFKNVNDYNKRKDKKMG